MPSSFDITLLPETLERYQAEPASPEALQQFAETIRTLTKADAVLLARYPEKTLICFAAPSEAIAQNLLTSGAATLDTAPRDRSVQQKFNFRNQTVHLLAVPCDALEKSAWLLVWARAETGDLDVKLAATQLASRYLPGTAQNSEDLLVPLLESLRLPHAVDRVKKFGETATELLEAHRFLLAKKRWSGWKIVASKGGAPDSRSPLAHTAVLASTLLAEESDPVVFGGKNFDPATDPTEGALSEMARLLECPILAAIPMEGWILFIASKNELLEDDLARVSETAPLLPVLARTPGFFPRLAEIWWGQPGKRRIFLTLALIAFVALMAWPFQQRIHANATLEPTLRRFVAAPFDSVLKKVHVATGDLVQANQLLVELDEREIRERIAELQAQAAAANLQGASDLAAANFNESALSILGAERAQHELELLRYRQNNLKVLSPISGVVVEGDLERAEGAAMSLGRPILEVAPLEKMIAEVAVREDDVAYVQPGMTVQTRFYALPSQTLTSKILKINPRSETRDGRNVFVAEAEIENPEARLRPGMKGEAVIIAEPMPLFWILFRKPWNAVRARFFW